MARYEIQQMPCDHCAHNVNEHTLNRCFGCHRTFCIDHWLMRAHDCSRVRFRDQDPPPDDEGPQFGDHDR